MTIALSGSGSWGTAVAGLAAPHADVCMWAHSALCAEGINRDHRNPRYLEDYRLPDNVQATCDLERALEGADGAIFAVPSSHLRAVAHEASHYMPSNLPILCLTKGIERGTGLLMSEIIGEECGHPERIAALSGPNHAEEVCRGGR